MGEEDYSLSFVETKAFTAFWEKQNLSIQDLLDVQNAIMGNPSRAPVIAGTGGLRKIRYAPASMKQGKRGGIRVCYAYFVRYSLVVLVFAYPKSRKGNLSPDEKKAAQKLLSRLERDLERRSRHL